MNFASGYRLQHEHDEHFLTGHSRVSSRGQQERFVVYSFLDSFIDSMIHLFAHPVRPTVVRLYIVVVVVVDLPPTPNTYRACVRLLDRNVGISLHILCFVYTKTGGFISAFQQHSPFFPYCYSQPRIVCQLLLPRPLPPASAPARPLAHLLPKAAPFAPCFGLQLRPHSYKGRSNLYDGETCLSRRFRDPGSGPSSGRVSGRAGEQGS